MAQKLHKLTAREMTALSKPGWHGDGGGLYVRISRDAQGQTRQRWVFVSDKGGQRLEKGLGSAAAGSVDFVSLADARKEAAELRARLSRGEDLKATLAIARTRAPASVPMKVPTFADCAAELIANKSASWRNAKHRAQWDSTLDTYAASFKDKPVDAVTEDDVLAALRPIWTVKAETASRVRGRIEAVLSYAKARKLRSGENPARWDDHLEHVLPARKRLTRGHHAAAPYAAVPGLYARVEAMAGTGATALRFVILTAARSGEVRGATWGEVDLEGGVWTIPAERMKAGREHVVPLSRQARDLLESVKPEGAQPSDLIFPGAGGKPLSDMTLSAVLRRMKEPVTPHGFRSSFRDWAGDETEFDRDTAEAALAHTVRDATERAYRRGSALEKRRALLTAWAEFICAASSR